MMSLMHSERFIISRTQTDIHYSVITKVSKNLDLTRVGEITHSHAMRNYCLDGKLSSPQERTIHKIEINNEMMKAITVSFL